jgi:superfamily I DNA/RNA helicase
VALALDELDVPDAAKRGATNLREAIGRARDRLAAGKDLAAHARTLFADVGLERELKDARDDEGPAAARRWDNVEFLLGALDRYEKSPNPEKPSLDAFLAFMTMRSDGPASDDEDDEEKDPRNVVTLSTLHAAKGLEFPVVFVIGCVEGVLPHSRTMDPKANEAAPADVEEERRLFYVGVTRARERLYLTRPKRRMMRGKVALLTPSRFLEGLPEEHVEEYVHVEKPPMAHEEIEAMAAALLAKLAGP